MPCFEIRKDHRVEFWETDAAGVVYFANFHRLMDTAMMEFFASLPVSLPLREYWGGLGSQGYDWVVIDNGCRFLGNCGFGDTLRMHLWVTKRTQRTLHFACAFRKNDRPEEIARGYLVACSTQRRDGATRAVPPLPEVAAQIGVAPWEVGQASSLSRGRTTDER
ncbi:MAG: acyl-CoA thioesterase [Candidatus Tectomicrobia bacterium]|nr:acyl-CoA thioesterase [Candidatus Tectomicrobia bacterium]